MKTKKSSKTSFFIIFFALIMILHSLPYLLFAQPFQNHIVFNQKDASSNSSTSLINNKSVISTTNQPSSIEKNMEVIPEDPGFYDSPGYMSFVSLGLLPGSQDVITITPISLDMSHGYYSPSGVYTGGGLAVETFDPSIMPVFGDLRFFFTKWNAKPWIGIRIGYAIPLSSRPNLKEKGGAYAGAGGGMIFSISKSAAFYFHLGYRFQKLISTSTYYNDNETKQITEFNRMEFRIGLSFH